MIRRDSYISVDTLVGFLTLNILFPAKTLVKEFSIEMPADCGLNKFIQFHEGKSGKTICNFPGGCAFTLIEKVLKASFSFPVKDIKVISSDNKYHVKFEDGMLKFKAK